MAGGVQQVFAQATSFKTLSKLAEQTEILGNTCETKAALAAAEKTYNGSVELVRDLISRTKTHGSRLSSAKTQAVKQHIASMEKHAEASSQAGLATKKKKGAKGAKDTWNFFEDIPEEIKTLHLSELHWPDHVAFLERLAFNYHGLLTPQAKLAELIFLMFLEMGKCVVFKSTLELMVSNVSQIVSIAPVFF